MHPQIAALPDVQEELEVIHRRSQLVVARSNILRIAIADPSVIEVVQYSLNEISVIGMELGSTTLTIWFADEVDPLIVLVRVIRDHSLEDQRRIDFGRLEKKLKLLFPNSKVYLIPLSGKIIVKGQARDSEEAALILSIVRGEVLNQEGNLAGPQAYLNQNIADPTAAGAAGLNSFNNTFSSLIVNMLRVPGESQIMLRVRVAELNRSQLRRLGVNLSVIFNDGQHALSSAMGGIPSTLTGIFDNGNVVSLLNVLASNGTIKMLAEPTITVLSGHSASFLAGGEFPVPTVVGIGGAQGQQTSFRGFGTSLTVTPQIIDRDLIRMQIVPEFSQLNDANGAGGIPGLDSRRVDTTVELREGQTVALAGLFSNQTNTEVTRIPILGSLPLVGALFRSKRATQDESELLVLVTPELVRPMEPDEVPPVPGFNVTHPNDYEFYKYGMTEGAPDSGVYQLAPFGHGPGHATDVGYYNFNPDPNEWTIEHRNGDASGPPQVPPPEPLPDEGVPAPTGLDTTSPRSEWRLPPVTQTSATSPSHRRAVKTRRSERRQASEIEDEAPRSSSRLRLSRFARQSR